MFKSIALTSVAAVALSSALAMADGHGAHTYAVDPSHTEVLFSYNHMGFSPSYGLIGGFEGVVTFNEMDPASSSVSVSVPASNMFTVFQPRTDVFFSEDFLNVAASDLVTFESTSIEVTGDNTGIITGDLTINGMTKSIDLDTTFNQAAVHAIAGLPYIGFDATASVLRSDFGLGLYAPLVGDEIDLRISLEAFKAE